MSHACLVDVPSVTVVAIAFEYAGVNVFDMDFCGVTSILGISRTSMNNRLVTQMWLASPQNGNVCASGTKIRVSGTMMQLPKIGSREKAGETFSFTCPKAPRPQRLILHLSQHAVDHAAY